MGDVQVAEMLQVKLLYLFRVKSFTSVDSLFPLSPCPNS